MAKVAICDDEKNIRTYLSALVRKQGMECEITEPQRKITLQAERKQTYYSSISNWNAPDRIWTA